MVGPLSFTLPLQGPGLATTRSRSRVLTHLVSFTVSPRIPHPGNFSNERKSGGESYVMNEYDNVLENV